jgi:orotate phosphoribosyltransferase
VKLNQTEIETLLKDVGAWLSGHFLLSSGLHSNQYIQCQKIMQYPRHGLLLAQALADRVLSQGIKPAVVVGPALGAVHFEVFVAQALDRLLEGDPVRGVFAERPEGKFEIRRGIELNPGEPVLVVEDVTTTGGSAMKVVELVRQLGARPLAVGAVIDRSGGTIDFGLPFISLVQLELTTWEPQDCDLCRQGLPLVKPGSSKIKNA